MMKTMLAIAAACAIACATTSAFALDWGAHNPVPAITPGHFACTLIGAHTYANDPTCETLVANLAPVVGGNGCLAQSTDPLGACYRAPKH